MGMYDRSAPQYSKHLTFSCTFISVLNSIVLHHAFTMYCQKTL